MAGVTSDECKVRSDLLFLPAPAPEDGDGYHRKGGERDRDRDEHPLRPEPERPGEDVGERNFPEPEAGEVHQRGRPGVAGSVEGRGHDHGVGVKDEAAAHNLETLDAEANHFGVECEQADKALRESHEDDAHHTQENEVVEPGAPDRRFGALGPARSQVLADHGCR